MHLYERIRLLAQEKELSLSKIAEFIDVYPQKFNQWLNEKSQKNLWEHLPKILDKLPDVRPEWLYIGEGEMLREQNAGVPPLLAPALPLRPAVAPAPDDGDLAHKLLDAYAQNARLAEELVRANEERRRLQELLELAKDAGAAPMPLSVPGERPDTHRG